MNDLFSGGSYVVIVVGVIAIIGGLVTITDYISRNKNHKAMGDSGHTATHK